MYEFALFLHLIGATVWVGGHLILAISILPEAMARRDPEPIRQFERVYERIGLPAMAVQIATGVWLAVNLLPSVTDWLDWSDPITVTVLLKLACLAGTIALAVHARLAIIPRLDAARLPSLAFHILSVTALAVCFAWLGLSFRFGGV